MCVCVCVAVHRQYLLAVPTGRVQRRGTTARVFFCRQALVPLAPHQASDKLSVNGQPQPFPVPDPRSRTRRSPQLCDLGLAPCCAQRVPTIGGITCRCTWHLPCHPKACNRKAMRYYPLLCQACALCTQHLLAAARAVAGAPAPSAVCPTSLPPRPRPAPPGPMQVASGGCRCKAFWRFNGAPYSYCANPNGGTRLL